MTTIPITTHKEIVKTYALFNEALSDGTIVRPKSCERCGQSEKRIHGHHSDYSKPYEVKWLCPACHRKEHRDNKVVIVKNGKRVGWMYVMVRLRSEIVAKLKKIQAESPIRASFAQIVDAVLECGLKNWRRG